jgi:hypothetical protein
VTQMKPQFSRAEVVDEGARVLVSGPIDLDTEEEVLIWVVLSQTGADGGPKILGQGTNALEADQIATAAKAGKGTKAGPQWDAEVVATKGRFRAGEKAVAQAVVIATDRSEDPPTPGMWLNVYWSETVKLEPFPSKAA